MLNCILQVSLITPTKSLSDTTNNHLRAQKLFEKSVMNPMNDYELRRFFIDTLGSSLINGPNNSKPNIINNKYVRTVEVVLLSDFLFEFQYHQPKNNTGFLSKVVPNSFDNHLLVSENPSQFSDGIYELKYCENFLLDCSNSNASKNQHTDVTLDSKYVNYQWNDDTFYAMIGDERSSTQIFHGLMKMMLDGCINSYLKSVKIRFFYTYGDEKTFSHWELEFSKHTGDSYRVNLSNRIFPHLGPGIEGYITFIMIIIIIDCAWKIVRICRQLPNHKKVYELWFAQEVTSNFSKYMLEKRAASKAETSRLATFLQISTMLMSALIILMAITIMVVLALVMSLQSQHDELFNPNSPSYTTQKTIDSNIAMRQFSND